MMVLLLFYNGKILLMYCVHITDKSDVTMGLLVGLARPTKPASIPGEGIPELAEEATPRKEREQQKPFGKVLRKACGRPPIC